MMVSARIARFAAEAADHVDAATRALVDDLRAGHGPLVEVIAGSDRVLVTFVYISSADVVRVSCELWREDFVNPWLGTDMTRVPGTDVWYASVEADPAVTVPYHFIPTRLSIEKSLVDAPRVVYADADRLAPLMKEVFESGRADPFNPTRHYPSTALMGGDPSGNAAPELWASVLSLPQARPFPYLAGEPLRGRVEHHTFSGSRLPGNRNVAVYTPAGYVEDASYPLVVFLDGEMGLKCGRTHEVLDEAIARGDLPPLVAVFWSNLTISSRTHEMKCNPELPAVLADELVPWLRGIYAFSGDASDVVIAGMSLGGLASAFTVLTRSDVFGAAFACSPSLHYLPPELPEEGPEIHGGWLTGEFTSRPPAPVKIFIGVGSLEDSSLPFARMNGQSMRDLARTFNEALTAHGYQVTGYREEPGGHDSVMTQRLVVPALASLLR